MTTAVQTAQLGNTNPAWRNRIINGGMTIDQRNAGASVSTGGTSYFAAWSVDRWAWSATQTNKYTLQQNAGSVTPPAGFTNYLGVTSSSAYSVNAGDYFLVGQRIEGFNVSDLAWGTASASAVTLSFKVYSSLTGTFGGALQNSGGSRSYPFAYTVSSANTWTTVAVTIPGDTSGTWLTTNGLGIQLSFNLGTGSTYSGAAGSWASANYVSATGATSVVGTNGATFYITGVQLEVGTAATSFEFRDYGRELMLCQRYFQIYTSAGSYSVNPLIRFQYSGNAYQGTVTFQVPMRATPTGTLVGVTQVHKPGIIYDTLSSSAATGQSSVQALISAVPSTNSTDCAALWLSDGAMTFASEL